MTVHEDLLLAFRKAVDFEIRFGKRDDVPEVRENWQKVVTLIEELCRKPKRELSAIRLPRTKTRQG